MLEMALGCCMSSLVEFKLGRLLADLVFIGFNTRNHLLLPVAQIIIRHPLTKSLEKVKA